MRSRTTSTNIQATLLERVPPAPNGMNEVAAKYWKKKCQDLKDSGRLTSIILESLAAYCNVLSDMDKARGYMDKAWGEEVFFRYQKAYNEANKLQISIARELGFTLASHKKTDVPKARKKFEFDLKVRDQRSSPPRSQ